jgi:hypothetical protein
MNKNLYLSVVYFKNIYLKSSQNYILFLNKLNKLEYITIFLRTPFRPDITAFKNKKYDQEGLIPQKIL